MNLYKYRDFSNPTACDFRRLETLLRQGVLWCARPDSLNDPEEFSWTCDYTASIETEALLTNLLVQCKGQARIEAQRQSALAISTGQLQILASPIIGDMIQQCRNEIGLICLGTSPKNPCLWQRYGGDGAGVCVEIEVPSELIGKQLFHVQYHPFKLIHIDQLMHAFLHPNHTKEIYELSLLSKSKFWAPEEEIRFISKKQNISVRIDGSKITHLHLGKKLTPENKERIEEIVSRLQ